jgi:hypothetical protein
VAGRSASSGCSKKPSSRSAVPSAGARPGTAGCRPGSDSRVSSPPEGKRFAKTHTGSRLIAVHLHAYHPSAGETLGRSGTGQAHHSNPDRRMGRFPDLHLPVNVRGAGALHQVGRQLAGPGARNSPRMAEAPVPPWAKAWQRHETRDRDRAVRWKLAALGDVCPAARPVAASPQQARAVPCVPSPSM